MEASFVFGVFKATVKLINVVSGASPGISLSPYIVPAIVLPVTRLQQGWLPMKQKQVCTKVMWASQ